MYEGPRGLDSLLSRDTATKASTCQPTRTVPLDPELDGPFDHRASHARSLGGGGRPSVPSARSAPPCVCNLKKVGA